MIWREIFLSKAINKNDLARVFSKLFSIDIGKINLIESITEFRDNDMLTCVVYPYLGDFCLKLDCFVNFKIENEFDKISDLCITVESRALISNDNGDDKDNPYSFILFEPSGQIKKVEINSQLLDEYDEMKIME